MTTSWSLSFGMRHVTSVVIICILSRLSYCCVCFSLLLNLIVNNFIIPITVLYILRKNTTITVVFRVCLRFWYRSRRTWTRSWGSRCWFFLILFPLLSFMTIYRVIKVALGPRSWILLRFSITTLLPWVITIRSWSLPIRLIRLFSFCRSLSANTSRWMPWCWLSKFKRYELKD